jgi:hypothetical protein
MVAVFKSAIQENLFRQVVSNLHTEHTNKEATPACDKMKAVGQWNAAWTPFYELDPVWTHEIKAAFLAIRAGLNDPREGRPLYFWSIFTDSGESQ